MNPRDDNHNKDESAIDAIEHELYNPKAKQDIQEIHHTKNRRELTLPTSWGDDSTPLHAEEPGTSFGVKLLIFSTVLLFIALSFSLWRVMSLRNVVSGENIDMTAEINPFVEGGEATPLVFTLRNRNTAPLESANITLLYKQGNGSQDEQEKVQEKRDLGPVKQNEYKKQDFSLSFYGSESETRDIVVKLEYKVAGSNAPFNKLITTKVVLRTPPISVSIDGPDTLSIGQSGTYTFTVKNNSATTSLPSVLQLTLPNSFTVESSNPKPISRTTAWGVGKLAKGDSQVISVTGHFQGKQDEVGTFQAKIGSQGESASLIGIVWASQVIDVTLRSSPLVLLMNLSTDSSSGESVKYGDRVTLTLSYNNGGPQPLEDVSLKLSLSGDAALYNSIDPTSGYYDSIAKTVTWDKATFPDLAVLPPNANGVLQVIIPIVGKGVNSPTLKGTFIGTAGVKSSNDVVATVSKVWAVEGSATLNASTQYKTSTFLNSGPIPPEPNKDTTYTTNLKVTAQNTLSSAKVSFVLPAYVTWRGVVSDFQSVQYDSKTRTVSWNISRLQEGSSMNVEVGLSVRPSQSHVGQSPAITSGIILDAEEEVSRAHLRTTLPPLTTSVRSEEWPENPALVVDR